MCEPGGRRDNSKFKKAMSDLGNAVPKGNPYTPEPRPENRELKKAMSDLGDAVPKANPYTPESLPEGNDGMKNALTTLRDNMNKLARKGRGGGRKKTLTTTISNAGAVSGPSGLTIPT